MDYCTKERHGNEVGTRGLLKVAVEKRQDACCCGRVVRDVEVLRGMCARSRVRKGRSLRETVVAKKYQGGERSDEPGSRGHRPGWSSSRRC
jgi:hypothetical protein